MSALGVDFGAPVINVDIQMRTNVPHIFAIGDFVGQPMLANKGRAQGHGHGKILGGGMVGTHAGDMIGEIALAIEMGADAVDIGKTIYHVHVYSAVARKAT